MISDDEMRKGGRGRRVHIFSHGLGVEIKT